MFKINETKYKVSVPEQWLVFTHPKQKDIHPVLAGRLAYLCSVKKRKLYISRGLVTTADQIAIGEAKLKANPTWYRGADGRIYKPGNPAKSMVAAPGTSKHEFAQAVDSGDSWFKALSNTELAKYGLVKPMSYEPWHAQLIETIGVSIAEIKAYYLEERDMEVKDFQKAMQAIDLYDSTIDNKPGPKTKAAAKECLPLLHKILGTDFKTAEEVIKAVSNNPGLWEKRMAEIPYFRDIIMAIVEKMKGLR